MSPPKVEKQIGPGVWQDTDGNYRFNISEVLCHLGLNDTPENRRGAVEAAIEIVRQVNPNATVRDVKEIS